MTLVEHVLFFCLLPADDPIATFLCFGKGVESSCGYSQLLKVKKDLYAHIGSAFAAMYNFCPECIL